MSQIFDHTNYTERRARVVHEVYLSPSRRRLLFIVWMAAAGLLPLLVASLAGLGGVLPWIYSPTLVVSTIVLPRARNLPVMRVHGDGSLMVRRGIVLPWFRRLAPSWRVELKGPVLVLFEGRRRRVAWPADAVGWTEEEVPTLLALQHGGGDDDSV